MAPDLTEVLRGRDQVANLDERQIRWMLAALGLGSFFLLLGLEIATEPDEISIFDLMVDALTLLLTISAAVGVALLAQRVQAQREEKATLVRDLKVAKAEGESWRAKVQSSLNGIRTEMANQFQQWGMTAAEQEVGLLILKGLNHKEIATLRGTSEATVRQQAQAIYRKADLPGKTAFSAYFLEDLFAPEISAADPLAQPSAPEPREFAALPAAGGRRF
jgi:DNA-binding CsgD family transcriptional regulator